MTRFCVESVNSKVIKIWEKRSCILGFYGHPHFVWFISSYMYHDCWWIPFPSPGRILSAYQWYLWSGNTGFPWSVTSVAVLFRLYRTDNIRRTTLTFFFWMSTNIDPVLAKNEWEGLDNYSGCFYITACPFWLWSRGCSGCSCPVSVSLLKDHILIVCSSVIVYAIGG